MASKPVIVTGIGELNEKLAKLTGPQAKAAIRKASRTALKPVAQAAKANAPRRTGRMAQSIKVRALPRSRVRIGSRVTSSGTDKQYQGKTFDGAFQEYGWRSGRRARNADIGAAKGAKRTRRQQAAVSRLNKSRQKINGSKFMKRAALSQELNALLIYRTETVRWIEQLSK